MYRKSSQSDLTPEKFELPVAIFDATCAPADITYPNDLGILNQARVQTEKILNNLYKKRYSRKGVLC